MTGATDGDDVRRQPEGRGSGPSSAAEEPVGSDEGREVPWVETRAGGLFFVNAVLVGPELVVLVPLLAGAALRSLGLVDGPSRFLDPVPRVAAHVLPWVGWLLVVPVWTTVRNLRMRNVGLGARAALFAMLALHLGFLGYTVWRWLGGGG